MNKIKKVSIRFAVILLIMINAFSIFSYADFSKSTATSIYNSTNVSGLKAKAYALLDYDTNTVVFKKSEDEKYNVGYLSQLMTLYVTYESLAEGKINEDDRFRISAEAQAASVGRSRVYLDAAKKEVTTVAELMDAVAICNAVDAAYALAEYVGTTMDDFVNIMNEKAKEIGMTNTVFTDATGIDRTNQYTTANDLVKFGKYFIEKYPEILELTAKTYGEFQHTSTGQGYTSMVSGNNLTRGKFYQSADGFMVGFSEDVGYSMLATVCVDEKRVVACVIGEEDENYRAAEIKKLLEYGISGFEYRTVSLAGTFVRKIPVKDGVSKRVNVYTKEDFSVILSLTDFNNLEHEVVMYGDVTAPVSADTEVGEIVYKVGDNEVGKVKVIVAEDIKKAGWFTRLVRKILAWLGLD